MIERFTKEEFEAALPRTPKYHFKSEGMINGENCYSIPIDDKSKIFIRSSIDSTGRAADCGEDSIRTFLLDNQNKPLGSKINRWTTRKIGWKDRMLENCRFLIRLRQIAGNDGDKPNPILKVKKEGPNKGRFFTSTNNNFRWLTDEKGDIIP